MPNIHFSVVDWIPVAAYLILLIFLGIKGKTAASEENFILSGRTLTLPAFVATLVSTWYGGILGVGEFSFKYGLANWFSFGLPYYIFAIVFAFFILPKISREKLVTLPDIFANHYSVRSSALAAFFVYLVTNPAPYLLMVALLMQLVFPLPLGGALLLIAFLSSFYLVRGGFPAVVRTDMMQFVFMFLGFLLLIPFAWFNLGSLTEMAQRLPRTHLTVTGGNSVFYILVWYFVALVTLVDPNFYQRCFAARNVKTARRGILIATIFWLIFDILTTLGGLYARAYISLKNPAFAYPILADKILPVFIKGLFFTSLLATIMSSLDSFSFTASISLSRDVLGKFTNRPYQFFYLPSLIFTLLFAILLAWWLPSVVDLWYLLANVAIPPLLFPIIIFYWTSWKPNKSIVLWAMSSSFIIALIDFIGGKWLYQSTSFMLTGLDPMYTGFLVNFVLYFSAFIHDRYITQKIK